MRRILRTITKLLAGATLAGALTPAPAHAQIEVRVVDGLSANAVPLAAVQSLDADGSPLETASTNTAGAARLRNVPGVRAIKVMALGYHTAQIEFEGSRGFGVRVVEVTLTPSAIELDSLEVEVESNRAPPGRIQFAERRGEHTGIFLDPFDVGIKTKYGVVHAFAELEGIRRVNWGGGRIMPTIKTNLGTGCVNYRINNLPVRDSDWNEWPLNALLPQDVMAIEIYRHFAEVPERLRKDAWPPSQLLPCGLVVIWTKEAW